MHLAFGGQEGDDDLGLVNMRGRVYDPRSRRFLSPDPVIGNAFKPQAYNPYAYVENDPINRVDPTGLDDEGGGQQTVYEFFGYTLTVTAPSGGLPTDIAFGNSPSDVLSPGVDRGVLPGAGGVLGFPSGGPAIPGARGGDPLGMGGPAPGQVIELAEEAEQVLEPEIAAIVEELGDRIEPALKAAEAEVAQLAEFGRVPEPDPNAAEKLRQVVQNLTDPVTEAATSAAKKGPTAFHHIFPQAFASTWNKIGLDFHAFTLELPKQVHQAIHSGGATGGYWNNDWVNFLEGVPRVPTMDEVFQQGYKMSLQYGLGEYAPVVPYPGK